jgi:hypothetical protein
MKPATIMMTSTVLALASAGCAAIGDAGDPGLEETLFASENGIQLDNGLVLANGAVLPNGTKLSNGLKLSNGIDAANGIALSNGTKLSNGITGPYYAPPTGSALEQWIDVDPPMRKRILRYLVECALPDTVEVQILYGGQLEVLGRGIGNLGPGLQQGEMSPTEQEKVSACLLARVNALGELVTIDMSGPMADGRFDQPASPDSLFVVPESGFFGNLFLASPQAYVCASIMGSELEEALCPSRSCMVTAAGCTCGVMSFIGTCSGGFAPMSKRRLGCIDSVDSGDYYTACYTMTAEDASVWSYPMTTHVMP